MEKPSQPNPNRGFKLDEIDEKIADVIAEALYEKLMKKKSLVQQKKRHN